MIHDNILKVRERICSVCARLKRPADSVVLVCVTKGRSLSEIEEAVSVGMTDIGESRIQEALVKYRNFQLDHKPFAIRHKLTWHLVGHLQTNKVKEAVKIFDLIHSVDSLHLAEEIDRQAARTNKVQDILVEIKISSEATKFGVEPEEALNLIKDILRLKNLNIKGLMTIAPLVNRAEEARPYFRKLRKIMDEINVLLRNTQHSILNTLSMGMSDDFEVAIEEGANMVRLGRAIFQA